MQIQALAFDIVVEVIIKKRMPARMSRFQRPSEEAGLGRVAEGGKLPPPILKALEVQKGAPCVQVLHGMFSPLTPRVESQHAPVGQGSRYHAGVSGVCSPEDNLRPPF